MLILRHFTLFEQYKTYSKHLCIILVVYLHQKQIQMV